MTGLSTFYIHNREKIKTWKSFTLILVQSHFTYQNSLGNIQTIIRL